MSFAGWKNAFLSMLKDRLKTSFGGEEISLQTLQQRYEKELMPYEFCYTLKEKGKKTQKAVLDFEKGNFCHLFSIASIVENATPDTEQFSGMKGWNNIKNGKITFRMLSKIDPQQFAYYHPEHKMFSEFVETLKDPQAVRYVPSQVKGSKLKADIILYRVWKQKTIHIALSKDEDGSYFPRSYFVRDVNKDRLYPTKYIANMPVLDVSTEIRKAK